MTAEEFQATYGFTPNIHELRIANGRDPVDESLPYDEKKWSQSIEGYRRVWRQRTQPKPAEKAGQCCHRGERVPDDQRQSPPTCNLCGIRGQPFDVFACQKHSECSLTRKHSEVRSCVTCPDFIEHVPQSCDLTIGMATFDDAARVRWTINALRETHAEEMTKAGLTWEIVVINNNPQPGDDYTNHSRHLRIFNESSDPPVRVIDYAEQQGTFPPKAKVFDVARGEFVIVMDCHCLIRAGSLVQTMQLLQADEWKGFGGIFHGVLTGDSGQSLYTHQEREYRDNMLAMWQSVENPDPALPQNASVRSPDVLSVPQHGAFLFGCRRDAWPRDKLPQRLRGFGGDENIDALFRSLGRDAVTFRWLKVWHDFIRLDQLYGFERTSSTSLFDRLRNDLLWCKATGETHRIVEALEHYDVPVGDKRAILKELGLYYETRGNLSDLPQTETIAERSREFRFAGRFARTRDAAVRA